VNKQENGWTHAPAVLLFFFTGPLQTRASVAPEFQVFPATRLLTVLVGVDDRGHSEKALLLPGGYQLARQGVKFKNYAPDLEWEIPVCVEHLKQRQRSR
jgi:hypothetical protein